VLLQQLAVFAGGFTIEAAETVCTQPADILSGISSLNDNSLLRRVEPAGQVPRFVMLETVREYGLEQLRKNGHDHETRERHAHWMSAWMDDVKQRIIGPEMPSLLDRCETEHDNLRAALTWLISQGSIDAGLQLANDSFAYWMYRGYFIDANARFEDLITRAGSEPSPQLARALGHKGQLNQALSNFERAMELTVQSIEMARQIGDQQTYALTTYHLADLLYTMGEFDPAEQYLLEALTLFEAQNDLVWSSLSLAMLSLIVHRRGDHEAAGQMVEEGLARAQESGYGWGIAICLNRQGRFASDDGDFEQAAALYQESLRLWNQVGDRWRVTRTLVDVADCAAMLGQPEFAARLLGAAEALNEPLATALRFADDVEWRRAHQETTNQLDPDALQRAWDRGRGMPWNQAVAEALEPLVKVTEQASDASPEIGDSRTRLSSREMEVIVLLVEGRTDREIAEALFISPRTAQGHVANIFNKLGVNSRTAAVATALQSGLLSSADDPTS
jgi:non-specific serine/threonine protein kinase